MQQRKTSSKYSFFQRNGLSVVFLLLFFLAIIGQIGAGYVEHNKELTEHGQPALTVWHYLNSGHFLQATFENWESEFLQMALFVVLTISLRQKGSSESKSMEPEDVDKEPRAKKDAPWPVKKGGLILKLYKNSLSIILFFLFIVSFVLHFVGSLEAFNLEQTLEHKPTATASQFIGESRFWFESFQNWQSEFLSVFAIVVLSIYFRQKGSAQSKPVDMPNHQNE